MQHDFMYLSDVAMLNANLTKGLGNCGSHYYYYYYYISPRKKL